MSDNFNEVSDAEAKRRAERINAIKRSVREASGEKQDSSESAALAALAALGDVTAGRAPAPERRPAPKPVSQKPMDVNDILRELDSRNSSADTSETKVGAEDIIRSMDESVPEAAPEEPVYRQAPVISHEAPPPAVKRAPVHSEEEDTKLFRVNEPADRSAETHETEPEQPEVSPKKKKKKKKRTIKQRLRGLFPQKGDSVFERIRKLLFLGAIVVIIVCGYIVADYYIDLWRSKRENDKVMSEYWDEAKEDSTRPTKVDADNRKVYTMLTGAKELLEKNSDVVGIIRIEGTPVNNPVMQAEDNKKYLKHKLSGRESKAGELFLDYRNHFDEVDDEGHLICENSDNLVIYGHEMGDGQMFGSLNNYRSYDYYYGEHPIIELNSNYEQYKYKIFSFFVLDAEDDTETKFDCWNTLDFDDEEEFYEFVNEAKRRTIRLNDVDMKYGDQILTLSTCNGLLGDRSRLIIMARMVREGEDPLAGTQNSVPNPNIKWPTLYYKTRTNEKYDPDAEFVPYGPESTTTAAKEASTETQTASQEK